MNLGELKAAVSDELVVPDIQPLTLARHINLAIRRIERGHDYTAMENLLPLSIVKDQILYAINGIAPRYKTMRKVWIEYGSDSPKARWFLEKVESRERFIERPRTARITDTVNAVAVSGFPELFFIDSQNMEVFPAPKTSESAQILYYRFLPDLANETDDNFFTVNLFDAVIYGAAMETARMLEFPDKMAIFKQLFMEAMAEGIEVDTRERSSGGQFVPSALPTLGFGFNRG